MFFLVLILTQPFVSWQLNSMTAGHGFRTLVRREIQRSTILLRLDGKYNQHFQKQVTENTQGPPLLHLWLQVEQPLSGARYQPSQGTGEFQELLTMEKRSVV